MKDKAKLLFSLGKKDFVVQTFRTGGKGGQKQNKTSSGVRIKHPASGAVGESREHRSQVQNKKTAFKRLTETKEFNRWVKVQAAMVEEGYRNIEHKVNNMMKNDFLNVEFFDPRDKKD